MHKLLRDLAQQQSAGELSANGLAQITHQLMIAIGQSPGVWSRM